MKRLSVQGVMLVGAVVLTVATTGFVVAIRDDGAPMGTQMGTQMMVPGVTSTPGWWDHSSDDMGSMMMDRVSPTSEPEYLVEMVAHHDEAVSAARELSRSDRPELRAFGESIVAGQSAQMRQMTSWLADWYPGLATTPTYEPMMSELSQLTGDPLDVAFLQDMIGHHMMAVMMSQQLLARGTAHDEVATLAESIRDDQHTEIAQMQRWLAQWFDTEWDRNRAFVR